MKRGLAADLARWERGELTGDAVVAADPAGPATELIEMHAWLSVLTTEPEAGGPPFAAIEARLARDDEAGAATRSAPQPRRPAWSRLGWARVAPSNP